MKLNEKDREHLLELIWERIKPTAQTETAQKLAKAAEHLWTCTNPDHGHGIVKVSWDEPPLLRGDKNNG